MKSNNGLNIYRQHSIGYKFCENLKDITPLQELYLVLASNYEAELQEKDMNKTAAQREMDDEIYEKLKEKGYV